MSKKGRIAVIVEGVSREPKYLHALQKCCLSFIDMEILCLPAEQNIYMLWKQMQDDDLETDLIEIVRESSTESAKQLDRLKRDDFMEIYLLFDFDPHQDNLRIDAGVDPADVLRKMVETFDNETEAGKLYISYPMIEALRDFTEWSCWPCYQCEIPALEL